MNPYLDRLALLALLVSLSHHQIAAASRPERPNIILVMCDDLGWGDVGFNGGKIIQTPHLDEMARNSLRWSRFYAAAPVCSPTRGSCLTGRHPYRYGIYTANKGHMKSKELTLAELLGKLGYHTGHFGKWHLGTLTKTIKDSNRGGPDHIQHFSPPAANGFQVNFSTEAKVPTYDPMLRPAKSERRANAWDALTDRSQGVAYGTRYWNEQGKPVTDNLAGDDSRVIMDRAVPFIETAARNKQPFFAVIWFHTPHLPVVAGPKHRKLYAKHSVRARNYYGCITAMDEQMGRLRATLRTAGVAENTMLWFCSDNGPEGNSSAPGSAGPFRGRKRSLYEGGVRVPALLEWPAKIKQPRSTDFPAVTSDYLPTILDSIGVEPADKRPLDGISLSQAIAGTLQQRPQAIGFQAKNMATWNDNQYKLVKAGKKIELYDLIKDQSESVNLADQHPDLVRKMKRQLTAWQQSCKKSDGGGDYQQR